MLKSRTCYLTSRLLAKSSRHEQETGRGGGRRDHIKIVRIAREVTYVLEEVT